MPDSAKSSPESGLKSDTAKEGDGRWFARNYLTLVLRSIVSILLVLCVALPLALSLKSKLENVAANFPPTVSRSLLPSANISSAGGGITNTLAPQVGTTNPVPSNVAGSEQKTFNSRESYTDRAWALGATVLSLTAVLGLTVWVAALLVRQE